MVPQSGRAGLAGQFWLEFVMHMVGAWRKTQSKVTMVNIAIANGYEDAEEEIKEIELSADN